MTHATAARALKAAALLTSLFGMMLVLALFTGLRSAALIFLDLVYLPLDGAQPLASDSARVLTAVSGGLMAGLGVLVWQITALVYDHDPARGRRILLPGLLCWYVPDCLGSLMAGAWFNLPMNTAFLALFLVPLLLARPDAAARPA